MPIGRSSLTPAPATEYPLDDDSRRGRRGACDRACSRKIKSGPIVRESARVAPRSLRHRPGSVAMGQACEGSGTAPAAGGGLGSPSRLRRYDAPTVSRTTVVGSPSKRPAAPVGRQSGTAVAASGPGQGPMATASPRRAASRPPSMSSMLR